MQHYKDNHLQSDTYFLLFQTDSSRQSIWQVVLLFLFSFSTIHHNKKRKSQLQLKARDLSTLATVTNQVGCTLIAFYLKM